MIVNSLVQRQNA